MSRGWTVDNRFGEAAALHAAWPAAESSPARRAVAVCRVPGPSVVLGSTQSTDVVDPVSAARSGVAVARRRSGGGAVLVTPGEPVWVDLWLPATDPLWSDDVSRAFDWVGDTWVVALERMGIRGLVAHRSGPLSCTSWSAQVCFGGVGRGEVVTADGRKVVGLAQRRTRAGAWFHGACALRWDPTPLVDLLSLSPSDQSAAVRELESAAVGVSDLAVAAGHPVIDGPMAAVALIEALPPTPGS
jgi:lipoate-protein ligase A